MENQQNSNIEAFSQLVEADDRLNLIKTLLSYPLINWTSQFFSRTRNAEMLLNFVDYCRIILRQNTDKISNEELVDFDKILIGYELSAYDRLNDFENYIALFEFARVNVLHTITYTKHRNDDIFNKYLLYEDERYKYVHFLYLMDRRYHIILRKKSRTSECCLKLCSDTNRVNCRAKS